MKKTIIFITLILICLTDISHADFYNRNALMKAIRRNDIRAVKRLVNKKPQLIHSKDNEGNTPLFTAALLNRVEVARYLISKGAKADVGNDKKFTPLMYAGINHSGDVFNLLLKNGADINSRNEMGRTLVHLAAMYGDLKMLNALAAYKAKMNIKDNAGDTPIDLARKRGRKKAVAMLMKHVGDKN